MKVRHSAENRRIVPEAMGVRRSVTGGVTTAAASQPLGPALCAHYGAFGRRCNGTAHRGVWLGNDLEAMEFSRGCSPGGLAGQCPGCREQQRRRVVRLRRRPEVHCQWKHARRGLASGLHLRPLPAQLVRNRSAVLLVITRCAMSSGGRTARKSISITGFSYRCIQAPEVNHIVW